MSRIIEMSPLVNVEVSLVDDVLEYDIFINKSNFDYLAAGCPDFDRLLGYASDGVKFAIFPTGIDRIPDSFVALPNKDGYCCCVGARVPTVPYDSDSRVFDRFSDEYYSNLEKAVKGIGRIPILDSVKSDEGLVEQCRGYARICLRD